MSVDPRTLTPPLITPTPADLPELTEPAVMPIVSSMPLTDWQGDLTTFAGFTSTRPEREFQGLSWTDLSSIICTLRPDILSDKRLGRYFIPCQLKEAPLVGNTLAFAQSKGLPTTGKMRSASHVTSAAFLLADVDGLDDATLSACFEKLKDRHISYVAFTTFSYGDPTKPGMRIRVAMPLDRPVTAAEYTEAWHGFDRFFFDGQLAQSDASSSRLHQQQGGWVCHPSRINRAKCWRNNAGLVSVEALLALGSPMATQPATAVTIVAELPSNPIDFDILVQLLESIDPDLTYPDWSRVLMALFFETQGSPEGLELADAWSCKGRKYKGSREIRHKWNSFRLDHPRPVRLGTLINYAREAGADTGTILGGEDFTVIDDGDTAPDEADLQPSESIATPATPLTLLQKQFGLINFAGRLCVFDRAALNMDAAQNTARKLVLSNRSDGTLLMERALHADYSDLNDPSNCIKQFFVSPQTVCYNGTEFNPRTTTPGYLNLWEGPTIDPQSGTWLLIQDFLYSIICGGNYESYLYLIQYIAHALQKPEEKPGVMTNLIGGQGIGKGTLGRILQKIWSATFIQVTNVDEVVGTFNAVLERSYIVFMDEALFAGNRRGTDELKSIVTEPIIQISEKYQPSRQIRSCHRFFAATNADHFKNTERDDRRDFTLRVSEARKGDLAYWKCLNEEIEYGGVEAMTFDLLQMDLSDFNVRHKPETAELMEQKLHSLDPIQRWWHDLLFCGDDEWKAFISTTEAIAGILEINGGRMHKKPSAITISQALQKLCPSATHSQVRTQFDRSRGYTLPPLQQARLEFEQYLGGTIKWPDISDAEESTLQLGPLGSGTDLRDDLF